MEDSRVEEGTLRGGSAAPGLREPLAISRRGSVDRSVRPIAAAITAWCAGSVLLANAEPGAEPSSIPASQSVASSSNPESSRPAPADRATQDAPGCLFTIETPTNTVFLLGSMHLATDDIYPLPAGVDLAYDECERIVFEVPSDSMSSVSAQNRLMAAGMYQDESKLSDHVPKALYDELIEEAADLGVPEPAFQQFRPWMAGMVVGLMALVREGYDPNLGIEEYLLSHARKDGKTTTGLETVDFQIGLFKNLTEEQSMATLRQSLLDMDRIEELAGEMDDLWLAGDVDSLAALTNETFAVLPEIAGPFLYDRNTAWIPAIEGWIGDSLDVLVVVGAAHLGGEGGVIDLLRQKGHDVKGPGIGAPSRR